MSKSVDDYILSLPQVAKSRVETIRQLIKKVSPTAVEATSYGLIGYKLNGRPLVYIGGFKNHIGLYAIPNTHKAFVNEFAKYKNGKGSVQFPLDQPLPLDLIKKVVQFRVEILTGGKIYDN